MGPELATMDENRGTAGKHPLRSTAANRADHPKGPDTPPRGDRETSQARFDHRDQRLA